MRQRAEVLGMLMQRMRWNADATEAVMMVGVEDEEAVARLDLRQGQDEVRRSTLKQERRK